MPAAKARRAERVGARGVLKDSGILCAAILPVYRLHFVCRNAWRQLCEEQGSRSRARGMEEAGAEGGKGVEPCLLL